MTETIQVFKLSGQDRARVIVRWDECSINKIVDLPTDGNTITLQAPFDNHSERSITMTINVSPAVERETEVITSDDVGELDPDDFHIQGKS